MGTSSDRELNLRIIELSQAIASLFDTADSTDDVPSLRDDVVRAISEQSSIARQNVSTSEPQD
ncbi:MAG: hypothetical protein PEGG_01682 [Paraeggerthella hongkongensis]|jgi:hypothetical protein|uniref:phenylalanyl-tRNA synthetase subunit alpha n=1 Tax=Paraeggerthella TaxID=651554 RepID=UPI000DF84864|nr:MULTISPECIES: phenylalanyl-tRNA synthetase subunit alpha [Paraeggerthella]MBU5405187.1 phenylalanyl-tRNA synthetase subunit alpha [Paraeggerthella hongkongensis]MCD2433444.1 phenylalanyl-tRNA synthetase subunit alpha [Paraeggerthella hominis]MDY3981295.1 phenylalanyl-tRNA synthetase subunit alpha [Paraeggerthella sp.]RDB58536.1 phenylalanyl-tRNA synthetase subunit alpha [Paraeggerthella hongkongensis]